MSVWLTIPSARPAAEANAMMQKWRAQGYRVALWRDPGAEPISCADLILDYADYPGYAQAVNQLVRDVLRIDSSCGWVVAGGDDTFPDPNKSADEIARECSGLFGRVRFPAAKFGSNEVPLCTFGVMQPTGDPFAGRQIERICGSPWMGREFCERINQGRGPLWPEYTHMFVDDELQSVAQRLGILWQRPDLTHHHQHFARVGDDANWAVGRARMPPFLREANSPQHWALFEALFKARREAGFPGHEPLPEFACGGTVSSKEVYLVGEHCCCDLTALQ